MVSPDLPVPPADLRIWVGPFSDAELFTRSGAELFTRSGEGMLDEIVGLCGLCPDSRVLEIGCGRPRVPSPDIWERKAATKGSTLHVYWSSGADNNRSRVYRIFASPGQTFAQEVGMCPIANGVRFWLTQTYAGAERCQEAMPQISISDRARFATLAAG